MESELIATLLIDKIISLAYRNHYVLKAENNLGIHCADYLINTLTTPFIEQNFLYYEYDDLDPIQVQSHSTQMFYNSSKTLLNTWTELTEPEPPTIDRDLSTLIEFTYSTTKRDDEDYLNTDSNNNRTFSTKDVFSRNSISKLSIRVESTTTQNDNTNNVNRRQSTRMSLIDLPSFPITLNDDDIKRNDDTPEIVALREEFEIEKMRILEERKKVEAEQEKERLIQQEKKQPKKGFNFNKVRFNINGELIAFKPIKLKDLSKDFYITRTHIKNLGKVRNDNDKRKQKEEVVIEHNPHLGDVAFPSTMTLPGHNNSNSNSSSNRLKDKFKKDDSNIIQPAGSNYDIFIPEVGVSLTEGTSKKGGNKDFSKRYKKTSSVDFDKMLHEYIPILNKAKMKPQQLLTDTNIYSPQLTSQPTRSYINIHDTNNININNNTNTVISGSGHNRSISLFNMSSNNPLLDGVNATNPIAFPSVNPSTFNSRLYRTSDIDFDSIKLGSNYRSGLTSLKYTLEEIADLDEGNLALPTATIGKGSKRTFRVCNTDMKVNGNGKRKQNDIETVNKFNAELMKKDREHMDGSSSSYFPTNKSALFRKPKRGNLIKELGKNIVMTKLPRSRRFNMSKFN